MGDGAQISTIRVSSIARDLGGRVWNPALQWTVKYSVFVEITLSDGHVGLGECWCLDAAPDALIAFLRTEVCPALIGATLIDARAVLSQQWRRATLTARHGILATAHSGVDLALWDAKARASNLPLWQVIDPSGDGESFVYASGGLYAADKGPDVLADELHGFVQRGFRGVKMKVGGMEPHEDVARVNAVRDRIGPSIGLIVDGVSSYDADGALAFFDRVEHLDILAFQAPLPPADLPSLRRLCAEGVPVMVGEAEYRDEAFDALVDSQATAILQVAPVACGGPSRVQNLAGKCASAGITLSMETASTAVATLSALHLGAALPVIAHVEIHQIHDVLFAEAGIADPSSASGNLPPPMSPGLGFALPTDRVQIGFDLGRDPERHSNQN